MEISFDKSKILINSIKSRSSANIWMNGPIQKLLIHTNQRQNTNKGSKDLTGASTLIHDKASNTMENTKPSLFQRRLNSTDHSYCQYCSVDVRVRL